MADIRFVNRIHEAQTSLRRGSKLVKPIIPLASQDSSPKGRHVETKANRGDTARLRSIKPILEFL